MGIGRWVTGEFVYVSPEKAEELSPNTARPGDIVFTQRGTLGQVAMVPPQPHDRYVVSQSQMKLTVDPSKADATFLYYFFISEEHQEYIRNNAIQTGVPHTNLEILKRTPLRLPPLPIQRRIANILGALDDKIECNRQINQVLEAMAQALYQHWFVDFGPFRDGEFVESELGTIPKGWSVDNVLSLAEILSGGTPSTSNPEYWGGEIRWASAKDVSQCAETFLIETERTITAEGLNNSATKIIPRHSTVVVARGATTGRFVMFGDDLAMNQTCYALRSRDQQHFFLYCWFQSLVGKLTSAAHGSVFDTITTTTFQTSRVLIPDLEARARFNEKVAGWFETILVNIRENIELACTRDYLLPKLLSGEIEVKVAEEVMEKSL